MIVEIAAVITAVATSATVVFQYKRAMQNTVVPITGKIEARESGLSIVRLKILPRHPVATICAVEGIGCELQPVRYEMDGGGGRHIASRGDHFVASLSDFNRTLVPGDEPLWIEFWAKPLSSASKDCIKICVRTSDSWLAKRSIFTAQTHNRTE